MQGFLPVRSMLKDEQGVTAIVVALVLLLLIGFAALAIDIGHLCVARAELQNAADAGALAGARILYIDDGTAVDEASNQEAYDAATANNSEDVAVEVNWTGGNEGDVQRGHWSFGLSDLDRGFYANSSLDPVNLWDVSDEELDANLNFINAVRVVTRRQATPVASFFAKVFGHESFELSAEAVAYIGFAGTLEQGDVDQPIAICEESITIGDEFSCNIGRMLNSGSDTATHNTAAWTNYSQPCNTASASDMAALVCSGGNPDSIVAGTDMGATGGVQQSTFDAMRQCWINGANDLNGDGYRETPIDSEPDGIPDQPWNVTLSVISCPGNNVSNCTEMTGIVNLNIVWMTEAGTPDWEDAPTKMGIWEYPANADNTNGQERWQNFVETFNLKNVDDQPAPYAKKSIYFLPDCTKHKPLGGTGGNNYGVLADRPVLVK